MTSGFGATSPGISTNTQRRRIRCRVDGVQEDPLDDDWPAFEELVLAGDALPDEFPEEGVEDGGESFPVEAVFVPLSPVDPSPFTSVGCPLFSDFVPGSFNLSE